jgi:hypothetical protein
MDDGNELTVSLKDYPHPERRGYAFRPFSLIGQTIRFNGIAVKRRMSSCPLHKRNIRDEK